jgi:hypothetical protein
MPCTIVAMLPTGPGRVPEKMMLGLGGLAAMLLVSGVVVDVKKSR